MGGRDKVLQRPPFTIVLCMISPLTQSEIRVEELLACAEAGIPIYVEVDSQPGATTPITIAGTMDALLPINHHARAYARKVAAVRAEDAARGQDDDDLRAPYRLYEVQNGNHIETFQLTFPQLEIIEPHAQRAFDLLVDNVEKGAPLPPDQCIPRGGAISASPAQPGHCAALFVP